LNFPAQPQPEKRKSRAKAKVLGVSSVAQLGWEIKLISLIDSCDSDRAIWFGNFTQFQRNTQTNLKSFARRESKMVGQLQTDGDINWLIKLSLLGFN